jgi:hypothetical protein
MLKASTENKGLVLSGTDQWLALGGIIGPIFFALAYTILGFLRPDFSQISEPVSGLGVGRHALVMNASFVIMGVLIFIGVIGIIRSLNELSSAARWICGILLSISPLGVILCGLFTYESFMLHTLGFFFGCGVPIISFLVIGVIFRKIPNYRRFGNWLIAGSPLTLILFIMFMATFDYLNTDEGIAGLIERVLILEVHAFYIALGWFVFRRKFIC